MASSPAHAPSEGPPQKAPRRENAKAPMRSLQSHGSFPHYYADRGGVGHANIDPRVLAMRPDWFNGRRCLDIGCHQGTVAIAIARRWRCESMVGVDLDEKLIAYARTAVEKARTHPAPADAKAPPHAAPAAAPAASSAAAADAVADEGAIEFPISLALSMGLVARSRTASARRFEFPDNVRFEVLDIRDSAAQFGDGAFDTVLFLSTSKWVHLNGGDEAIIALFEHVHRMLTPGGAFIFEPQPWTSYQRKKHMSETTLRHYSSIELRPEAFPQFLLDYVGFRCCEQVAVEYGASVARGFASRPLFLFIK